MKLKFNFNKRNRYKNICSIEGCNNSACGKYCNKHYHQIKRYGHIKTRTRFDKNEIIINDNVAKILLYDNNCNVIDYTISGGSAPWEINLVQKLCDWNIISPLRFTDDEWSQISSDGTCQNRRKSDVFKEPNGSIHYNGALVNVLLVDIILILENGLIIKILFVGMVDYLNIKIIFLLVDILVFIFYSNMILTKDGCLNLHKSLIVLK